MKTPLAIVTFVVLAGCVAGTTTSPPPDPPTGVAASPGEASVTLTWDADEGLDCFVYWSLTPGAADSPRVVPHVRSPWIHEGLAHGVLYYYVVTAAADGAESAPSEEVSAAPYPPSPRDGVAVPGDREVTLDWQPLAGATAYNVYWSTDPMSAAPAVIPQVTPQVTHRDLDNGTSYTYWLTSVVDGAESLRSAPLTATPRIAAPRGLNPTPGFVDMVLTWSELPNATRYTLYASTTPGLGFGATPIPDVTPPYRHRGLAMLTTYYYTITASDGAFEGAMSAEVFATTGLPPTAEVEPNDLTPNGVTDPTALRDDGGLWDPSAAQGIYVPSTITGEIAAGFDVDWYRLVLAGDGVLTVTLTPDVPADLDAFLVEPETLVPYGFAYACTDAQVESFSAPVSTEHDYVLLVNDFMHTGLPIGYTLATALSLSAPDPEDDNDSIACATVVDTSAGGDITLTGTIGRPDDIDWYFVDIDWDFTNNQVTLTSPTSGRYDLFTFGWSGGPPDWTGTNSPTTLGGAVTTASGHYYLAVAGAPKEVAGEATGFAEPRFFDALAPYTLEILRGAQAIAPNLVVVQPGVVEVSWIEEPPIVYSLTFWEFWVGYDGVTPGVTSPFTLYVPHEAWGVIGILEDDIPAEGGADLDIGATATLFETTFASADLVTYGDIAGLTEETLAGNGATTNWDVTINGPAINYDTHLTVFSYTDDPGHLRLSRSVALPATGGVYALVFDAAVSVDAALTAVVRPPAGAWTTLATLSADAAGETVAGTDLLSTFVVYQDDYAPERYWRVACDLSPWAGQTVDVGLEYHSDAETFAFVDSMWIW